MVDRQQRFETSDARVGDVQPTRIVSLVPGMEWAKAQMSGGLFHIRRGGAAYSLCSRAMHPHFHGTGARGWGPVCVTCRKMHHREAIR